MIIKGENLKVTSPNLLFPLHPSKTKFRESYCPTIKFPLELADLGDNENH